MKKKQTKQQEITIKPELLDLLPTKMSIKSPYYYEYDDLLGSIYYLKDLNESQEYGWMQDINSLPLSWTMWLVPIQDQGNILKKLESYDRQIENSLAQRKNQIYATSLQAKQRAIREMVNRMTNNEKVFSFSLLFQLAYPIKFNDPAYKEELKNLINELTSKMRLYGFVLDKINFTQDKMLLSYLPLGYLFPATQRITEKYMASWHIATSYPFTKKSLFHKEGVVIGRTVEVQEELEELVVVDRWNPQDPSITNPNMVILGRSGSGKSYATKLYLLREWMQGARIIIIDPEREYNNIARQIGGKIINAGSGEYSINPFEVRDLREYMEDEDRNVDPLSIAKSRTQTILKTLMPNLFYTSYNFVDAQINRLYDQFNIRSGIRNYDIYSTHDYPNIYDFIELVESTPPDDRNYDRDLAVAVAGLSGMEKFFVASEDIEHKLDLHNDHFVIFDIHDLKEQKLELQRAVYFNILTWIWDYIRKDRKEKTILVVDEAWILLDPNSPETLQFLVEMAKRIRKYMGSMWIITQNVNDFFQGRLEESGKAVLGNASFKLLFKQAETDIPRILSLYTLTEKEQELLSILPIGRAIMIAGDNHLYVNVKASPFEERVIQSGK
mgnify:FL=1